MFNSCLVSLTDGCIILLQKVLFLQLSTYVNVTKVSLHITLKVNPRLIWDMAENIHHLSYCLKNFKMI